MKKVRLSQIKLEEINGYEERVEELAKHFGPHWKNVLADFKATNLRFIQGACGDPEVPETALPQAEQAVLNYLTFYSFGVANTIDPKSDFNVNFDNEVAEEQMKKVEKIVESQLDSEPEKLLNEDTETQNP